MKNIFKTLFLVLVVSVMLLLFSHFFFFKIDSSQVSINGIVIKTEVVSRDNDLARGLSGRKTIKENESMLFVFQKPMKWGIWMKDMNFPIDVIWLDQNGKVVDFVLSMDPKSYPKTFYPTHDSSFVLETATGFIEKAKIKIGDSVNLPK